MPANFLSLTNIDEHANAKNDKAIAAAMDPFTPTLAEEQAADPDMIKFKQFFIKNSWTLGTFKSNKHHLWPLLDKFFYQKWTSLDQT